MLLEFASIIIFKVENKLPNERPKGQKTLLSFFQLPTKPAPSADKPKQKDLTGQSQLTTSKKCPQIHTGDENGHNVRPAEGTKSVCNGDAPNRPLNDFIRSDVKHEKVKDKKSTKDHREDNKKSRKLKKKVEEPKGKKEVQSSEEPNQDDGVVEMSYLDFLNQNSVVDDRVERVPNDKDIESC